VWLPERVWAAGAGVAGAALELEVPGTGGTLLRFAGVEDFNRSIKNLQSTGSHKSQRRSQQITFAGPLRSPEDRGAHSCSSTSARRTARVLSSFSGFSR